MTFQQEFLTLLKIHATEDDEGLYIRKPLDKPLDES